MVVGIRDASYAMTHTELVSAASREVNDKPRVGF